jgi:S-methylmethionine-dependent homocysteine/selenocysteine methylase
MDSVCWAGLDMSDYNQSKISFEECFRQQKFMLMEGALGERLKREYGILPDETLGLAGHVYNEKAKNALCDLYCQYLSIARKHTLPVMITTPTRRANRERIAHSAFRHSDVILDNVALLRQVRQVNTAEVYLGGLMGCKGDAYSARDGLSIEAACPFHSWQAEQFLKAGVDFLYAGIMPALPEAIGMARAMGATGLPYIISFMIRSDGKLLEAPPSTMPLLPSMVLHEATRCAT